MRKIVGLGLAVLIVLLYVLATTEYLGYHYFAKYEDARAQSRSIESNFLELEKNLKKAVHFYHNPDFYGELGRLYLDRALAENAFGSGEKRDSYLDQALAAYTEQIRKNAVDSYAYYDLGRVYMLYNFPLLTYAEKGRQYFKKALELDPGDDFLNIDILYVYLTQWSSLRTEENEFLAGRLQDVLKYNPDFIPRIRDLWKENFGGIDRLKEILTGSPLWVQLQKYF